ncbi:MAG: response regulator transcription factor [Cyanothece sp. SIO2G6]|nr:response regulator transcription factor [Cyanothece sp. SIO2G6]
MRILLVDDEYELTGPLSIQLKREGYQVDVAYDGDNGYELAQGNAYDLLIVDWMLPGQSGIAMCQQLRQMGLTVPVLLLTAKDTIDDRVAGLDAGADDYLVKPFELKELLARVRALLRRPLLGTGEPSLLSPDHAAPSDRLWFENLELDEVNQLAYRGDRTIDLSEKETRLLHYLMTHPNQIVTHQELYDYGWQGDRATHSNVLAAQIRLLRKKIDAQGESALIHTVYGKGYRLGQ